MNTKKKEFTLDEMILETVRNMQPISSGGVWMEIGENFDLESNPSQTEVNQILEKIEREGILKRIRFKSEEEKFMVVEK